MRRLLSSAPCKTLLLLATFQLLGCDDATSARLARKLSVGEEQSQVGHASLSYRHRLGVVAARVDVVAEPHVGAKAIGTTVAGTLVPRSDNPVGREGCDKGWYAVEPRGYICLNDATTLDENHPTLKARALSANPNSTLPYPYAVTRHEATLYEPDPKHNDGVREQRKIAKGSIFAVVGTWNTLDEFDQRQRVALLTSGQFVSVRDIEAAKLPQSVAVTLDGTNHKLPLAFVVAEESTSNHVISPSEVVELTGASRLVDGERLWTRAHGGTLRDRDAIVVRARQEYPSFVDKHTHYADLDLTRGVLVLYEGKTPSYVTLAMRLPRKKPTGTAYVRNKQVTTPSSARVDGATAERRDLAWHLELDNGLVVQAAAGLNGYRESSQSGAVELHPDDAKRLFQWLLPELPSNWHGVVVSDPEREGSPILLH